MNIPASETAAKGQVPDLGLMNWKVSMLPKDGVIVNAIYSNFYEVYDVATQKHVAVDSAIRGGVAERREMPQCFEVCSHVTNSDGSASQLKKIKAGILAIIREKVLNDLCGANALLREFGGGVGENEVTVDEVIKKLSNTSAERTGGCQQFPKI